MYPDMKCQMWQNRRNESQYKGNGRRGKGQLIPHLTLYVVSQNSLFSFKKKIIKPVTPKCTRSKIFTLLKYVCHLLSEGFKQFPLSQCFLNRSLDEKVIQTRPLLHLSKLGVNTVPQQQFRIQKHQVILVNG